MSLLSGNGGSYYKIEVFAPIIHFQFEKEHWISDLSMIISTKVLEDHTAFVFVLELVQNNAANLLFVRGRLPKYDPIWPLRTCFVDEISKSVC